MSNLDTHTYVSEGSSQRKTTRFLDISICQLAILWAVYRGSKITATEISNFLKDALGDGPEGSVLNTRLEYMRGKGLVRREPGRRQVLCKGGGYADRPVQEYSLTPEGETAILDGEWALKQVRGFSV